MLQKVAVCSLLRRVWEDLWKARAFVLKSYYLTKRDLSWVLAMLFYSLANSAAIVLIGETSSDKKQTQYLLVGVLLWAFLSSLLSELAFSIAQERLDGAIEDTLSAPISRFSHLLGISVFAWFKAACEFVLVALVLSLFVKFEWRNVNWTALPVLVMLASYACLGWGIMAAVLPLLSVERGYQATYILQGVLLLISGVYYPPSLLPPWLSWLSMVSPVTYALSACRKAVGVEESYQGEAMASLWPELSAMLVIGTISMVFGFLCFSLAEKYVKRVGKLKRSG